MKQKENHYIILLGFIILCGLVLRFWNFFNIPFTFDELSAMGRTTFESFHEMIRIGVVERDSHPAGIQTFLYYWSMLFGEREWVIKLPFIIAGIASIYLSYRIGEIWFGKTTAMITAAYVASLQLFVMYSQIARPYISGLFFTMFAVLFWSKYFFKSSNPKYLAGFVLFSALAAYNHYFSLLFITVLGFTGLILVHRKNIIPYIISGVLILVLYLPHLSILFAQAEKGTIGGWLGAPGPYFIIDFFYWLFHYSYISIAVFLIVLFIGLIIKKTAFQIEFQNKKRLLLILWLLPAPIFGYVYSLNIEPILQNSLLIFSTPYLFILLFSYVGEWKFKHLGIAVIVILLVNIFSLVFTRDYYKVFYHQPFDQLIKNAIKLESKHENDVMIMNDYIPYYTSYYFRKYNKTIPFFTTRNTDITIEGFKQRVSETNQSYIITSGLNDIYFQIIKEQFPYWIGYEHGFTYEQYTFSKKISNDTLSRLLIAHTNFTDESSQWQFDKSHLRFDQLADEHFYLFQEGEEYGPKLEMPLKDLITDIYWVVDVEIELMTDDPEKKTVIVGEIKRNEDIIHWQGSAISEFGIVNNSWQKAFMTVDIQKAMKDQNQVGDQMLRIYIWNRDKKEFQIKKISVYLRPGNPERYSL